MVDWDEFFRSEAAAAALRRDWDEFIPVPKGVTAPTGDRDQTQNLDSSPQPGTTISSVPAIRMTLVGCPPAETLLKKIPSATITSPLGFTKMEKLSFATSTELPGSIVTSGGLAAAGTAATASIPTAKTRTAITHRIG